MYARYKSYVLSKPSLPSLETNGRFLEGTDYIRVRCLSPPATRAVLELVKCGCLTPCRGTCHAPRTDYLALLFANVIQLDAITILSSKYNEDNENDDDVDDLFVYHCRYGGIIFLNI